MFYLSYEGPALKNQQVWPYRFESHIKFKVIKVSFLLLIYFVSTLLLVQPQ